MDSSGVVLLKGPSDAARSMGPSDAALLIGLCDVALQETALLQAQSEIAPWRVPYNVHVQKA